MSLGRIGVILVAATLCAVAAPAAAAPRWRTVASGGMKVSDQVGLHRTSDGVLHVVWRHQAAAQDLMQSTIVPGGAVGPPRTLVSGWASIGSPALVGRDRSMAAFFPGTATLTTGDPTYGLDMAASTDSGASWSAPSAAVSHDAFAFSSTPAAVLTVGGAYLQAWNGPDGTVVHAGLDPNVAAVGGYGTGGDQALATTYDGQVMVAWCDADTGVALARVDPGTGARIGDVLPLPDSGRCPADTRVALSTNRDGVRLGEPHFFAAVSSASGTKVRFYDITPGKVVSATTLAGGTSFKQQIAIANAADSGFGSVWAAWRDSDSGALVFRRWSNPQTRNFGAAVRVPLPAHQTISQLALDPQDDRVDAIATTSDDSNTVSLLSTQVYPGLTLEGGNAAKIARKGFRVLDDEVPLQGATVKVAGRTLKTDSHGYAKVRLARGSYRAIASRDRYTDATVRVVIR